MTAYIVRTAQAATTKIKALTLKAGLFELAKLAAGSIAFLCVVFNVYVAAIVALETTAMQTNALITSAIVAGTLIGAYYTLKGITE